MLVAVLMLQAVAGPPVPRELRKPVPRAAASCTGDTDEIVVCARPDDQRLEALPATPQRAPEDAMTFGLPGGGTGNVHAIRTELPGASGQGIAATLRIPLGRRAPREDADR